MCDLNNSLTEIDWLNSLRIKKEKEYTCVAPKFSNTYYQRSFDETNKSMKQNCYGYEKPSFSYAYLIKLAIESSENNRMKLNEIYDWIMDKYPYYKVIQRENNQGWKNAIRHNLSLNNVFKRCPKNAIESGKGCYWTIEENSIQNLPMKKVKTSHSHRSIVSNSDAEKTNHSRNLCSVSNNNKLDSTKNLSVTVLNSNSKMPYTNTLDMINRVKSDLSTIVHSNTENKMIETLNSSCEISYLEVEDDEKNGKNSIILKTPVLSQFSSEYDLKDTSDGNFVPNFSKFTSLANEVTSTFFDNTNHCDSFLSIHQSFFESETFDSRHASFAMYTENRTCHEISFSENLFLTKSHTFNEGFQNQVIEDQSEDFADIVPSQEFLEMKSHLRSHCFKSNILVDLNKPSSVSTSSTVKSTNTVKSNSLICDKTSELLTGSTINPKDVLTKMDEISKAQLSEDDDMDDCFNWSTFL